MDGITIEMLERCAASVHPKTLIAIIANESGGNPLALGVNRKEGAEKLSPKTTKEAIELARSEIAAGNTVDVGLMQVNSANFTRLGLHITHAFEPCVNLTAGARVLSDDYQRAAKQYGYGQRALQAAISAYNTGNFSAGYTNGYVAKYYEQRTVDVAPYGAGTEVNMNFEIKREPQ